MAPLLIVLTIAVCLTVDWIIRARKAARTAPATGPVEAPWTREQVGREPGAELAEVPGGVFLAPGHTWVQLEPSGAVRVGTDRLPMLALGGLQRLEVPEVGAEVPDMTPGAITRTLSGPRGSQVGSHSSSRMRAESARPPSSFHSSG